jgi:hypothetical protein
MDWLGKRVFIHNDETVSDFPPWEKYRQIVSRFVLITENSEIIRYFTEWYRSFDVGFRPRRMILDGSYWILSREF